MHATVVMLIALGGLGCQNPVSDLPPVLPDVRQSADQPSTDAPSITSASPASPAPLAYPVNTQSPSGYADAADDESFGRCVATPSAASSSAATRVYRRPAEIEAAYHAGQYNR